MSYKEKGIVFEGKRFWVLQEKRGFTVCQYGITHSVSIQTFPLNEDGKSLAVAYAKYKDSRAA